MVKRQRIVQVTSYEILLWMHVAEYKINDVF